MDYHDLSIRAQNDGDILAYSEQGECHGKLNLDQKEVGLALHLIAKDMTDEDLLKKVGTALYNALFDINISKHLAAIKTGVAQSECGVRLRLIFEKSEIAALPWEFLYDDSTNTFLANDPKIALSRYIDIPLRLQDIKPASLPLKMLLVISSPKDLSPLDLEGEKIFIEQALQEHINSGQIEIDVLTKATIVDIDQRLNEKPYNVFHFMGHGVFEDNKGHIALMDEDDNAKLLNDQGFADLFLGQRGLGLIILNSCEGAEISSSQVFGGMAPRLVQRGIPAVIAMQYSIRDSTAKLFADKFYRSLALAKPVDEAVQSTRNLISIMVGRNKRDFATPVLYMRAKDGIILDLAKKIEGKDAREEIIQESRTKDETLKKLSKPSGRINRAALRKSMAKVFTREDLILLCADIEQDLKTDGLDLEVSLDQVTNNTRLEIQILDLIEYLENRGYLDYLVKEVLQHRPEVVNHVY